MGLKLGRKRERRRREEMGLGERWLAGEARERPKRALRSLF